MESHGQLYVALSRAKTSSVVKIIEPKKYYDAMQVSETTGDWTVIVQVVEKRKPELAKNGISNLQEYVLTDMKGTHISAVSFNANIDTLDKLLIPFKRYEISNADLKFLNPLYRIGPYPYEWILKTNHMIEEIYDEKPYPLPCTFNLARFSDLSPYAELNEYLNVKALIVGSIPVLGFADDVRDYILINEEKIPMVLRLWENYLDNDEISVAARLPTPTLIIGITLRVTTFHGISLSTAKYNTRFLIEPPLPDAVALHEWYEGNKKDVAALLKNQAYNDINKVLPQPKSWYFKKIKQINTHPEQFKAIWVMGRLELMIPQDQLWQPICSNCRKYFKGKINWSFNCPPCKKKSKIIARGRMEVYIVDDSGPMAATIFSPHFEKITGITQAQIQEAAVKNESLINEVEQVLQQKRAFCFAKFYKPEHNYTIIQLYTEQELAASELAKLQLFNAPSAPQSPDESVKEDSQLFSPSMANALEDSPGSSASASSVQHTPHSKRALIFGSVTPPAPEDVPEKVAAAVETSPGTDATQSPIKKSKKKDHATAES